MEKRKWSAEEKYKILEEAKVPGASIAEVCRRHQISSSLYYHWERQAKQGCLKALKGKGNGKKKNNEAELLKEKISRLKSVVSEITEENLTLKKRLSE